MNTLPTIGFIGLGIMGTPMALNLINAGYKLVAWARKPNALTPVVSAGARVATLPHLAAQQADVIILMVSDTSDVIELVEAMQPGFRPGQTLIDMSTIAPSATRSLAALLEKQGIEMLDAPVSGGQLGAQQASLSIMVGGKAETLQRMRSILARLGSTIVHIGDHGAGQVAKACNQMLVAQSIIAVSEALLFAQAQGVDAEKVRLALLGGFGQSRVLEVHGQRMLRGDYAPGFKLHLHQKDLAIVTAELGRLQLELLGTAMAQALFSQISDATLLESDSASVYQILAKRIEQAAVDSDQAT